MTTANQVIIATMQKVQGVAKKDKNQSQGFNFRGIDAVMNAVGPAIREAGGFISPTVLDKTNEIVPSRNGGNLSVVRLTVQYAVYGSEGEPITGVVVAEAFDSGDKATAKAMSVAYRTFLLQLLCLPTDEPDPDSHSYEIAVPAVAESALVDWLEAVKDATTLDELKTIWTAVAEFSDQPVQGTTLKAAITARKKQVNK